MLDTGIYSPKYARVGERAYRAYPGGYLVHAKLFVNIGQFGRQYLVSSSACCRSIVNRVDGSVTGASRHATAA